MAMTTPSARSHVRIAVSLPLQHRQAPLKPSSNRIRPHALPVLTTMGLPESAEGSGLSSKLHLGDLAAASIALRKPPASQVQVRWPTSDTSSTPRDVRG